MLYVSRGLLDAFLPLNSNNPRTYCGDTSRLLSARQYRSSKNQNFTFINNPFLPTTTRTTSVSSNIKNFTPINSPFLLTATPTTFVCTEPKTTATISTRSPPVTHVECLLTLIIVPESFSKTYGNNNPRVSIRRYLTRKLQEGGTVLDLENIPSGKPP